MSDYRASLSLRNVAETELERWLERREWVRGQKASRARGECCIPTGCLKFKRLHANEIDFYEHSMVATLLHTHTHTSTYTYTG